MTQKKEEPKIEIVEENGEGIHASRCFFYVIGLFLCMMFIGIFVGIVFLLLNINIDMLSIINSAFVFSLIIFWMSNIRIGFVENVVYENKKHKPFEIWFEKMYYKKVNR